MNGICINVTNIILVIINKTANDSLWLCVLISIVNNRITIGKSVIGDCESFCNCVDRSCCIEILLSCSWFEEIGLIFKTIIEESKDIVINVRTSVTDGLKGL